MVFFFKVQDLSIFPVQLCKTGAALGWSWIVLYKNSSGGIRDHCHMPVLVTSITWRALTSTPTYIIIPKSARNFGLTLYYSGNGLQRHNRFLNLIRVTFGKINTCDEFKYIMTVLSAIMDNWIANTSFKAIQRLQLSHVVWVASVFL
jgi:hypothetical protein